MLPIAYYLLKRGLPTSYDSGSKYTSDRVAVRQWLLKALLRGVFGSMGDTVLSNMRAIIKSSHEGFPSEALADKLQQMNRPIRFTEEDIDYILATRYGQKQVFLVLSLLYPWVDYRNAFHLDHIHPQTMFSGKKLKQAHLPEQDIEDRESSGAPLQCDRDGARTPPASSSPNPAVRGAPRRPLSAQWMSDSRWNDSGASACW